MGFGPPRVPTIEPRASQMPRKQKIAIWFILMATAACKNFSLKNPVLVILLKHSLLNLSMKKTRDLHKKHNRNHGVSRTEPQFSHWTEVISLTRCLHEPADMWTNWKLWWKMARNDSHPHQLNELVFSWFYFATEGGNWWYINTKNPAKPWNLLLVWREKVPWSSWSKEGTCAAMFALLHIMTPNLLKLAASCHRFGMLMGVSKNSGIPKSSILIGFFHYKPSIWGYPQMFGNPLICHVCSRFLDKQLSCELTLKTVKLMRTLSSLELLHSSQTAHPNLEPLLKK